MDDRQVYRPQFTFCYSFSETTPLEEKLEIDYIKIYEGKNEFYCYINSTNQYHVDAMLEPNGWKVGVFTNKANEHSKIKQILLRSNYDIIEDDGKHR